MAERTPLGHLVTDRSRRRTTVRGWKIDENQPFSATASTIDFGNHRTVDVEGVTYGVYDLTLSDPDIDEPWTYRGIRVETTEVTYGDTVGGRCHHGFLSDRESIHESRGRLDSE